MIINIKDTLFLEDNNEYVVVSKIDYENKKYYCLIDINNSENLKFCYQENDELVELNDKELNTELLPFFYKASKDSLLN